jgi:acyl carrier protein
MIDVHTRLTQIFRDTLDESSLVLAPTLSADDVENWDSLSHVDLIVAIEKEFRVRFTTGEVSALKNVGELEALIQTKISR